MISKRAFYLATAIAFVAALILARSIEVLSGRDATLQTATDASGQPVRVRWRMPLSASRSLPGAGETPIWLAETLLKASHGAFVLDLYDPGEIVPAFAITDAVRDRKVEAGYTWLGYDQGKIPSSPVIAATPFGLEPWAYFGWWYFAGGKELAEEIYAPHNMKPIFCAITGPETAGWFRSPLTSAADLEGLKIRFAGIGGRVMQPVGASVTMLPSGEIFQALETGVIDATEYSQPITDQALGFSRIAKYNYFPGWHQPFSATHMVVNIDVWNATSPGDQALLEGLCTGAVTRNLGLTESMQGAVIREFRATGVKPGLLPDDLLAVIKEAADEVLEEEAAKDVYFKRVLESQRAFQADYNEWRRLAYPVKD